MGISFGQRFDKREVKIENLNLDLLSQWLIGG